MKHQSRLLVCTALLVGMMTSCATPPSSAPLPPSAPPPASILPNVLVKVGGRVAVRRKETTNFVPAGVGAQVEPGDLLRVEGGEAAIFCGNETLWPSAPLLLAAGKNQGVPCLAGRSPRPAPDLSGLRGQAGPRADNIPYVLSPRKGFVRSDRPTLRWHALTNTDVYTITLISDDGVKRTPVRASGGELAYPAAWPSLAGGGVSYRLVVQAGARSSEEAVAGEAKSWGFSLLGPAKAAQLQSQEEKLGERQLGKDALTLLLAELYLNDAYRLRSEAAELLSGAAVENLASAQVLLGEVYLEMGLIDEARTAFDRALMLAQQAGLPEIEAGAEFWLGTAACLRWDNRQAEAHWQAAQAKYAGLGVLEGAQKAAAMLGTAQAECTRPSRSP